MWTPQNIQTHYHIPHYCCWEWSINCKESDKVCPLRQLLPHYELNFRKRLLSGHLRLIPEGEHLPVIGVQQCISSWKVSKTYLLAASNYQEVVHPLRKGYFLKCMPKKDKQLHKWPETLINILEKCVLNRSRFSKY